MTQVPVPNWIKRAAQALPALLQDAVLCDQVNREVEEFYVLNPDAPRTQHAEGLLRALIFNRLTSGQADTTTTRQEKERTA